MPADAAEVKAAETTSAHVEKKKSDKLPFVTLLVVMINTVVLSALGYVVTQLWEKMKGLSDKAAQLEQAQKEEEEKPAPAKEFIPPELGVLYPLESFLVNISSDRGPRFLQMQMELELDNAALEDEIALKRPALRDAIILLLTSRTYAELREKEGIKKLRADLIKSINGLLKTGNIREIYFTQFHFN
jgi:flagellar protein FliL